VTELLDAISGGEVRNSGKISLSKGAYPTIAPEKCRPERFRTLASVTIDPIGIARSPTGTTRIKIVENNLSGSGNVEIVKTEITMTGSPI